MVGLYKSISVLLWLRLLQLTRTLNEIGLNNEFSDICNIALYKKIQFSMILIVQIVFHVFI